MGCSTSKCLHVFLLLFLLFGLASIVVALVTDYWCDVSTEALVPIQDLKANNYRFGLWRRCYDSRPDSFNNDPDIDTSGNNCIWIYKDLVPDDFDDLPSDDKKVIHLTRSVIGLSITASTLILSALLVLICGTCPLDCQKRIKRATVYTATAVIILFAGTAGIASGVCFMAARDIDEESDLDYDYLWSFMLHWIGSGLTVVAGFVSLMLLRNEAADLKDNMRYYHDW